MINFGKSNNKMNLSRPLNMNFLCFLKADVALDEKSLKMNRVIIVNSSFHKNHRGYRYYIPVRPAYTGELVIREQKFLAHLKNTTGKTKWLVY